MKDRWQEHEAKWHDCHRCIIAQWANRRVLGQGSGAPENVDVLFIGEMPGKAEDLLGVPNAGRAGRLLQQAIEEAGIASMGNVWHTNFIACRPATSLGVPNRTPSFGEVKMCEERLQEAITILNPSVIVFLGKVAHWYGAELVKRMGWTKPTVSLPSPGCIIRRTAELAGAYANYVESLGQVREALISFRETLAAVREVDA